MSHISLSCREGGLAKGVAGRKRVFEEEEEEEGAGWLKVKGYIKVCP